MMMTKFTSVKSFILKFWKQIPKERNQMRLLSEFLNEDITFYVNITNRTDGKTFQYLHFFILLSLHFNIGFTCICRHYDLRQSYEENIENIMITKKMDVNRLSFDRQPDYTRVCYGDKVIGIIVELLNATDLKYHSNYIKDFPILYYDEFLALPHDYVGKEWLMLETIYESIDRSGLLKHIKHPKVFLTANPLNFESDILLNLNLFNALEKSDIGEIKIVNSDTALLLENNKEVNKIRNMNAFASRKGDVSKFESFIMNKMFVVNEGEKAYILMEGNDFVIELEEYKVCVHYVYKKGILQVYLAALNKYHEKKALFCEDIKDMELGSIYLSDKYYKDSSKKYALGLYQFDNIFTKDVLTKKTNFVNINLLKCITYHYWKSKEDEVDENEIKLQKFNENRMLTQSRIIYNRLRDD